MHFVRTLCVGIALAVGISGIQPTGLAHADGMVAGQSYEQGAEDFITALANKAIERLSGAELPLDERKKRFREILAEGFAVDAIGKWVLGRYWRQLDEGQQARYLSLFESLLVDTYAPKFREYSGEQLEVINTVELGDNDLLVRSQITKPNADRPPVKVDWRVRSKSGRFYIVDIMIEGISMGQTQRSEFASLIRNKGGKVEALLSELAER